VLRPLFARSPQWLDDANNQLFVSEAAPGKTDISQSNTDISQSNTDISQSKPDISQYQTDISQSQTDISQYHRVRLALPAKSRPAARNSVQCVSYKAGCLCVTVDTHNPPYKTRTVCTEVYSVYFTGR
jgi:hypothetical protein